MNKTRRELECLTRYQSLTTGLGDILIYLKEEKLITDVQIKEVKDSAEYPKSVQKILYALQQADKLQLLEYTWTMLPVEHIKILIITDRNQKEFTYDE